MNFEINENQKMIADMIQQFGKNNITPFVREWDEKQIFPVKAFKKLGELGLMGVLVPTEYGGSGFSYNEYVTAIEQLAILDPSIALSMAAHNSLCTGHILQFGNEKQKKKWLPKLATGQWIGAWGLTEPNTGSDAMRMKCTAVQDGDYWVINGTKNLEFEDKIKKINENIKIFYSKYKIKNLDKFKNKKVLAFAGIGNPSNFFELLKKNNINVKETISYPDHYNYSEEDYGFLIKKKEQDVLLATTEKDYYRLNEKMKENFDYVDVDLEIDNKNEFINLINSKL